MIRSRDAAGFVSGGRRPRRRRHRWFVVAIDGGKRLPVPIPMAGGVGWDRSFTGLFRGFPDGPGSRSMQVKSGQRKSTAVKPVQNRKPTSDDYSRCEDDPFDYSVVPNGFRLTKRVRIREPNRKVYPHTRIR
jgi:hypothetical protein